MPVDTSGACSLMPRGFVRDFKPRTCYVEFGHVPVGHHLDLSSENRHTPSGDASGHVWRLQSDDDVEGRAMLPKL